jgi:molybdate transport system ATP-binding protein
VPIVLVTHDLHEARRLADRMVILDRGQTLQQGTPSQVLSQPRNARVAALVGIQNHFDGVFRHGDMPGWAWLQWGAGVELQVRDKGRIGSGMPVTWVVAAEHIGVHREAPPGVNVQRALLAEALPLGDIALCRFELPQAGAVVQLHEATAALQRGELVVGREFFLQFDPAGLHIMPTRQQQASA